MDHETASAAINDSLSDLVSDVAFGELESRFVRFCPFEAVGMVRTEIRHSNFLAYILNPFRPHGFGTVLLRSFLKCAFGDDTMRVIETAGLNDAEVRREWQNIDLLILLPQARHVVAIELKIDASQSDNQLERYRDKVQRTWPSWTHVFLFLTKHQETPNDRSWVEVNLSVLVEAFSHVAAHTEERNAQALEMLRSYISMMRKHHLGDFELEKVAAELWSKHGDALAFLMDRRPNPLQQAFDQIRADDTFSAKISHPGVSVVADKHSKRVLRYAFEKWDALEAFQSASDWTATGRLILLEMKLEETGLRVSLMVGPGKTSGRQAYIAALVPGGRGRYVRVAEEVILTLNSEGDVAYEDLVPRMANFTRRVFDQFDPVMREVSAELADNREMFHITS